MLFPELGDTRPGIFVEECRADERLIPLSKADLVVTVALIVGNVRGNDGHGGWHRIGYDPGRSYGDVSFNADIRDGGIMNLNTWRLGEQAPDEQCRAWAVEFPDPTAGHYVRRAFWYPSRFCVQKNADDHRALRLERQRAYAARRLARHAQGLPPRRSGRRLQGRARLPKPLFPELGDPRLRALVNKLDKV